MGMLNNYLRVLDNFPSEKSQGGVHLAKSLLETPSSISWVWVCVLGLVWGFFCKITLELIHWLHVCRSSSQIEELQQLKAQSKLLLETAEYSSVFRLKSSGNSLPDVQKPPGAPPSAGSLCAHRPLQTLENLPLTMAPVSLK